VALPTIKLKHVAFTGGGTAGHVIPNLPIIDALLEAGVTVSYLGSRSGLEAGLLGERVRQGGVQYHGVATGKLRRYFSAENLRDVGRVLQALWQAYGLLGGPVEERPEVLFSKGGYVSLPVVWAAWLRNIPIIAHESDQSPGLANRLALPCLHTLCTNFPNVATPGLRGALVQTGTPLRQALLNGDKAAGLAFLGLPGDRPLLLVTGGSLGAEALNAAVRTALPTLLKRFCVVHLCGPGKLAHALDLPGYRQFEYLAEPWGDVLAAADVVLSRAGANSLYELAALAKPNLLVPLPAAVSRGDQVENAQFAADQGFSLVLAEEALTTQALVTALQRLLDEREAWQAALARFVPGDALPQILQLLGVAGGKP
jgi:UDP-N-acetylglucosamine--N-acetylmuramyl-(pentapeptide) pyrophosphoryl-undecaprenol N-acetylglucosamine transferase